VLQAVDVRFGAHAPPLALESPFELCTSLGAQVPTSRQYAHRRPHVFSWQERQKETLAAANGEGATGSHASLGGLDHAVAMDNSAILFLDRKHGACSETDTSPALACADAERESNKMLHMHVLRRTQITVPLEL